VAGRWLDVTGAGYAPSGAFTLDGVPLELGSGSLSPPLLRLLRAAALAGDSSIVHARNGTWAIKGDPTEAALVVAAAKAGLHKAELEAESPRVHEVPFTSEAKRMTTVHDEHHTVAACAKGAPEVILAGCVARSTEQGDVGLDDAARSAILQAAQQMAGSALRVLAIADKRGTTIEEAAAGMTYLGLVGMSDPPRPEAQEAVRTCAEAGIRVVMITGDHPVTAQAVAGELGLLRAGRVVTGAELEQMGAEQFAREVERIDVYARVSPADKLRIVDELQGKGHVVAMTGDGVNDAPALKKADIGVAMGVTGTDVAREAAAMTLTDDNFASIVAAVEEGRGIFGNIKKYLMFLLSSNIGEIGLIVGAAVAGLPLPLTAVQILYVNLATDGLPALALSVDPPEADLMRRAPRDSRSGIFTRPMVALMLVSGCWAAFANVALFAWLLHSGRSEAESMSMIFVALVIVQFWNAFNFRSNRFSVFARPFANRWLNRAILWELTLLLLIVYVPFLQSAFETHPLSLQEWALVVGVSFTIVPVLEAAKWLARRGAFGPLA
jgi:Ca2+-transporting ATPase